LSYKIPNVLPIIVTVEQAPSSKVIGASNEILKKAMFAQQTITGRRTAAWNEPRLKLAKVGEVDGHAVPKWYTEDGCCRCRRA